MINNDQKFRHTYFKYYIEKIGHVLCVPLVMMVLSSCSSNFMVVGTVEVWKISFSFSFLFFFFFFFFFF